MIRDFDRIEHMIDAIAKARTSVAGLTKEAFFENDDKKAAAERYIMIVGEAASRLSDEIKSKYPNVPWREACDMRNFVAHEYMKVDYSLVWDAINKDFQELERWLIEIKSAYPWPL